MACERYLVSDKLWHTLPQRNWSPSLARKKLATEPVEIAPALPGPWTANEVRILRDLAKHHASLEMLAYHVGRTVEAIQQKAQSINLALGPSKTSKRIIRKRIA